MKYSRGWFALLALVSFSSASAQEFGPLLNKVPGSANVLIIANLDKIEKSAVGVAQGVEATREKNYAAGLSYVPPDATKLVAAAEYDFEHRSPLWETVLVQLPSDPSMASVARNGSGKLDTLSGRPAVAMPGDAYLVSFGSGLIGAMAPAPRHSIARWAATADRSPVSLSPYLTESASFAETVGTEIIVAADLTGLIHPDRIKMRLMELDSVKSDADRDALAKEIASIRGMTLGIRVTDRIYGALKVDFSEDIPNLGPIGKAVLLDVLGDAGMMIDELPDWNSQFSAKQIMLEGVMSAVSARLVTSLVNTSIARIAPEKETPAEGGEEKSEMYEAQIASQQYFSSVQKLLDDFLDLKRKRQTFGQVATYMERYATKIDRLPMLNVDNELLQYGAYVSETLRAGSAAIRGTARESREAQSTAVNQGTGGVVGFGGVPGYEPVYGGYRVNRWGNAYYGYSTWWRPYGLQEQQSIRTNIRIDANNRSNNASQQAIQSIEQASADVRRKMTEKYKAEF